MERPVLSVAMEDCLKAIFRLERGGADARTGALAVALGVSAPTATQAVKRLAERGLVDHAPYRGVALTAVGRRAALEVVRHHRLIERYLHDVLGLPVDRVHGVAERWEHVLSEEVEARMARALGHPTRDPHGSPIPTAELQLPDSGDREGSGSPAVRASPHRPPKAAIPRARAVTPPASARPRARPARRPGR